MDRKRKGTGTNSGKSDAKNLEVEITWSRAESVGGCVKLKTVTEINRLWGACQSAQEVCEHTMILNGVSNFQLLGQMNNSVKIISVTVFNFTHPPTLSALLQILSASRFLAPDFPLLVPTLFLSSAALHGMTFPFLSDRNHLWTLSNQISRHNYFFKTIDLTCFPLCIAIFVCHKSLRLCLSCM